MGQLKDALRICTRADQGKDKALSPAWIVHASSYVIHEGTKLKGYIVLNDDGLFLQGKRGSQLLRVPLVLWSQARRIEIDGRGYERIPGRSVFGASASGGGIGYVVGSHRSAETHLVVTTDDRQQAWTLPLDPTTLRNLMGKVLVQVEQGENAAGSVMEPSTYDHAVVPHAEPRPVTGTASTSIFDQVVKLASLREQGLLTDEEFAAAKAKLLGADSSDG